VKPWRVLPVQEWDKLSACWPAIGEVKPETMSVVVVEDDAGVVIGAWALITLAHVEGFWIDPAHQKRAGVLRRLWAGIRTLAAERQIDAVITGADSPQIEVLLEHVGAQRLPAAFLLPLSHRV